MLWAAQELARRQSIDLGNVFFDLFGSSESMFEGARNLPDPAPRPACVDLQFVAPVRAGTRPR
jgi:hypothetical protein